MGTILWFKRDLRIEDNAALALAAAGEGPVLPLYIVEPALWAEPDMSARQWRFIAECMEGLRGDLARLGAPLLVRMGDAVEVLEELRVTQHITRLVSHEETGNLWTFARDRRVAAWARANGVVWCELAQPGITRGLAHRRGWQARRDKAMRGALAAVPAGLAPHGLDPGVLPDASDLGLDFDPCPGRQKGGRARALDLQSAFLERRAADYLSGMSSPVTAGTACSRLSPHLALGTLSMREAVQALGGGGPGPGPTGGSGAMGRGSRGGIISCRSLKASPRWKPGVFIPPMKACVRRRPMPTGWRPGRRAKRVCPSSMPACAS